MHALEDSSPSQLANGKLLSKGLLDYLDCALRALGFACSAD